MDHNTKIIYTGESDVVINQEYLSLTFCRDWFFSKDKKCYGIPVRMECTDATGDAFFRIRLHDANNNLDVGLSLDYCRTYNAVVWVERSNGDSSVDMDTSVAFCGKNFPQSMQVVFCIANLSESVNTDQNKVREQDCYSNLEFIELWKLRKDSLCLDGIVLDAVLQNKLRPDGFIVDPQGVGSAFREFESIYYVWCGLHVGSKSETFHYKQPEQAGDDHEMNGLKISAVVSHRVAPDGSSVLSDELCVFATDKEHPDSGLNSISRIPYDLFMEEVIWDDHLTNLLVHFEPDEINDALERQFIDIPVKYHDRRILLRLMLNPNWDILFIVIQNKLQEG